MEKREKNKEEHGGEQKLSAEEIARDYTCNKVCRLCPYPGLKCTPDSTVFARIH